VQNSNPVIKIQAFKVKPEFKRPALNMLLKIDCYNLLDKVYTNHGAVLDEYGAMVE
jgi:hypothetical protein